MIYTTLKSWKLAKLNENSHNDIILFLYTCNPKRLEGGSNRDLKKDYNLIDVSYSKENNYYRILIGERQNIINFCEDYALYPLYDDINDINKNIFKYNNESINDQILSDYLIFNTKKD